MKVYNANKNHVVVNGFKFKFIYVNRYYDNDMKEFICNKILNKRTLSFIEYEGKVLDDGL